MPPKRKPHNTSFKVQHSPMTTRHGAQVAKASSNSDAANSGAANEGVLAEGENAASLSNETPNTSQENILIDLNNESLINNVTNIQNNVNANAQLGCAVTTNVAAFMSSPEMMAMMAQLAQEFQDKVKTMLVQQLGAINATEGLTTAKLLPSNATPSTHDLHDQLQLSLSNNKSSQNERTYEHTDIISSNQKREDVAARSTHTLENCNVTLMANGQEFIEDEPGPLSIPHSDISTPARNGRAPYMSQPSQPNTYYKLVDLPTFDGDPLEWPMFERSFINTTEEFNYSNRRNVMRLRKALVGEARAAVQSLLPFPDSVPEAMEILKENFGRPEQLINRQIAEIRKLSAIQYGNAKTLIKFSNSVKNVTALIKYAGAGYRLCDVTLLTELVGKLPYEIQLQWAIYKEALPSYATIEDLSKFMDIIAKRTNAVQDSLSRTGSQEVSLRAAPNKGAINKRTLVADVRTNSCLICNKECAKISECEKFKGMQVDERWKQVQANRLCYSCLKPGHSSANCYSKKRCPINECNKPHHNLLHKIPAHPPAEQKKEVFGGEAFSSSSQVWFQVLPVEIKSGDKTVNTYAFIDHGSSHSMVEWSLIDKLNVTGKNDVLSMRWLSNVKAQNPTKIVALEIKGLGVGCSPAKLENVFTVRNLSLPMQSLKVEGVSGRGKFKQKFSVEYENAQPEILLGLDNVHLTTALEKPIVINKCGAVATRTRLGWVVYGSRQSRISERHDKFSACSLRNLEHLMKEYFDNDDVGTTQKKSDNISIADRKLIEQMQATTKYENGRYEVQLLWRSPDATLPDSYKMAMHRLNIVNGKFRRDSNFAESYKAKINGFIEKGYARKLSDEEAAKKTSRTFYLPHFAVRNPNKEGVRVVFDAAAEIDGISLNKQLLAGPDLNKSLLSVIFKFRHAPIAIVGDIKEMFLQVAVRAEDQDSQRFLWYDEEGLNTYVMQRMIFGATCSPTLAQFVKNMNAQKYMNRWPRAAAAIINNHYVDDYVDSFHDEDEAIDVVNKVITIHKAGGFELRNFASNSSIVLQALGNEGKASSLINLDEKSVERVLGMHWNCVEDVFTFVLKFHKVRADILELKCKPTKREVLSIIMSVFDPFGLVSNFMLLGKLLMQNLWTIGIGWDDKIPDQQFEVWQSWITQLAVVRDIKVPRCFSNHLASADKIQLHIFADASEGAMSAVAYVRVTKETSIEVSLVMGKTKCAPLKYTSIPRLELQAAVIAVRLKETIRENLLVNVDETIFWSDSKTVLGWIRSDSRKYKQYVANRIGEIQQLSNVNQWRWISTKENVADDGTRICRNYTPDNRWLKGPNFLYVEEQHWQNQPTEYKVSDEASVEEKAMRYFLLLDKKEVFINYHRFSNYLRLKRVMAWILRFVNNVRKCKDSGERQFDHLCAEELGRAENSLCKIVQQEAFEDEYSCLISKQLICKGSVLLQLNPIIDENGIMRLAGRIDDAECLSLEQRRPILLPKDHYFTRLLVSYYHVKLRHLNRNTVMCEIRQKFWVPSLRVLLKSVEDKCNFCKLRKTTPQPPMMGKLPVDRLTPFIRAFSYTGIDFFGPLTITVHRRHEKRWVSLFTCLTTRAVHLELVADLSSDACILAIRNFINRRGIPVQIRSDNGTNFIGIAKELKDVNDFLDYAAIGEGVSNLGIQWRFNCPANPSEGGAWERLVQSVKKVLAIVLKDTAPRIDTLISVLIEAENIVNSRPLTHLPISSEEEDPLTPNHFLLNGANSTQTPAPDLDKNISLRKQWRIAQNLKNAFWRRWIREYLPELTRRTKWCQPGSEMKTGDLVLICETDAPRSQWKRGRIIQLFKGRDGIARSAEIKTAQNILKRPVSKLAKIDVIEEVL